MKEAEVLDQSAEIDARTNLLIDPDTSFGERFEAVITDMLNGKHITQTNPDEPGLFRKPIDNEDEPTEEF